MPGIAAFIWRGPGWMAGEPDASSPPRFADMLRRALQRLRESGA
ncbi:hypothetical protein AvCA_17470 [Azotobacter vinelandii CA]|uniref:Uncharacterized protein n=2 Tax=Azotobacter vinelandii TaxID=354 RepID=C1DSK5_AZOVD|nr:hypothetical protein Avin_17470 [Azotobacter vinelandii DJ]AGK15194.1 hypothetical protein AvCA_17470 [Azotobacter vinelandii CA]AGK20124.1 hypothetical protein AvCA6_17470 [Azotobacter vinelandii CA6]